MLAKSSYNWKTRSVSVVMDTSVQAPRLSIENVSGKHDWKSESSWYVLPITTSSISDTRTHTSWVGTPPRLFSAPSRRGLPASLQTHCCCRCCSCCGCWVEVENDVQGVAFCLPLLPFLPFSPWDLSRVAHFLRGPGGCTPHSSTVSRRLQVRSVVDSDPPCVAPPCHVSVRHVATFVQ